MAPTAVDPAYASLLEEQSTAGLDDLIELSEADLEHLKALFAQADVDGNGVLDLKEFEALMSQLGQRAGKR